MSQTGERPDDFLRAARESGAADPGRLGEYLAAAGPDIADLPPDRLADRLVRDGLLTRFQADQLLRGKRQGFVLGGTYRVLDVLGAGGMGQVLLCEHVRLGTPAAVKLLPPDRAAEPAAAERFRREARVSARLRHPRIVRAYDLAADGGFEYLVMDFVDGVSLEGLVAAGGPLAPARAGGYVRQAAAALEQVRRAGLVHRDVKPGNLLVDRAGVVHLLDMGLARSVDGSRDDLTGRYDEGAILGTADYMAPEQADGSGRVDARADVYALGGTLYFLLAGRPPFAGGSLAEKLVWHRTRTADLRAARPDVPAELDAAYRRMTAKDPADRFPTPGEAADALARWAAPAPPTPDELPRRCPAVERLLDPVGVADEVTAGPGRSARRGRGRAGGWLLPVLAAGTGGLVGVLVWAGWGLVGPPGPLPPPPPPGTFPDPLTGVDADPTAPLLPEQAVGRVGRLRTVRMIVKTRVQDEEYVSLASNFDAGSPELFTVLIPVDRLDRFKARGIDPFQYYFNEQVAVTGYIVQREGRAGAAVIAADPDQIRMLQGGQ
jgi:hypothetical protein